MPPTGFMLPSHTDVQTSLRAVKLLEQLVRRTWDKQLPPLDWRVTFTGTLVGDVYPHDSDTVREIFDVWVAELELTARPEYEHLGVTRLEAAGTAGGIHV